jgi:peptidoglycan/xylan/chitin deacetylase (PgdA/CDA1 family)
MTPLARRHSDEPRLNVTFHGVGVPSRALAPGEARVWISTEQFLDTLNVLIDRSDVRICFDDGNASDVRHALPALQERGLTAAFFVVADRLGQRAYLGPAELRELAAAGMTIGSHGMSHRPWRRLLAAELETELHTARTRLEDVTGTRITQAACPYGAYDRRTLRSLRRFGYECVFTSDTGMTTSGQWLQARNSVYAGHSADRWATFGASPQAVPHAALRRARLAVKRWR